MSEHGSFAWHELRTSDADAAGRFYGALFGWTFEPHEMGATILAGGVPIGGASAVKPGLPDHWTPFVACADVDAVAAAARSAGGIVTTGEPADVPGIGRLAPILDPAKTIVAALTPGPAVPETVPGPGRFVWERLWTPDPAGAGSFYAATFGWTPVLSPDGEAGVFERAGGGRVAEMLRVAPDAPGGWLSFVLADRVDDIGRRATELGGTAGNAVEIPGIGRFAEITDPQGATLAAWEPAA